MVVEDLGIIEYGKAWEYQQELFSKALLNKEKGLPVTNTLLLCEHPPVITIGKHGDMQNLLFQENYLKERGVSLFRIDRGGDVTYHGPGQLVAYPIFDLEAFDIGLRQYIANLEEVLIRLLASYQIAAQRLPGAAGVWLDTDDPAKARKIAAIGVRSSRFVTMHGFALNVNTDLSYFSLINPCGFVDKGVTSMQKEQAKDLEMDEVKEKTIRLFEGIFTSNIF
ncbi:lipoyl(octanoyl) transferase LipB [Dysgonomonas sp. 511]|uniref:lipoyl(octanoyl) transferase LipB n=1 Tax=Dysgonomonas sp. 511 TaxID=2302930 RepID=UPI0013D6D35B|nr:lipoyl(octanoyl) transferase LipB [Dysgonomonas sp. 511]NDV77639.1 lipoyl(octanoyl) transferase LipB [Dysgonomonas sp. 511]